MKMEDTVGVLTHQFEDKLLLRLLHEQLTLEANLDLDPDLKEALHKVLMYNMTPIQEGHYIETGEIL